MNSPGDEKFLRGGAEPSRAGEGVYFNVELRLYCVGRQLDEDKPSRP